MQAGMTVEEVIPPTERRTQNYQGCWSIELTDPIHNHMGSSFYFHRYVEHAGLMLYDFLSRPGEQSALVCLIVGKPKRHEE